MRENGLTEVWQTDNKDFYQVKEKKVSKKKILQRFKLLFYIFDNKGDLGELGMLRKKKRVTFW